MLIPLKIKVPEFDGLLCPVQSNGSVRNTFSSRPFAIPMTNSDIASGSSWSRLAIACAFFLVLTASALTAGTISGTVTDAETGASLPSMIVAAYGASGSLQATATTDSAGRYSLSLPAGSFRVLAYDNGLAYATTFAGGAESFESSPPVSGDLANCNFSLIKGGTAIGSVSGGGSVLSGITVAAYNLSGTRRAFATTNANGVYTIVLPPGVYKFVAFDDNALYASSFYSNQLSFASAATISIQAGQSTGVSFQLRVAAHIGGIVSDAQSHLPLSGFIVSAYSTQGILVAAAVSDSLGRYQLTVPDGTLRLLAADPLHVYATGYFAGATSFAQTPGLTLVPGQSRAGVSLEAERGGTVSGHVTAKGAAICCITVSAYNPDGSERAATQTDVSGSYLLVVPPGDFRIGAYDAALVYAPQFYAASTTFHGATSLTVSRSVTTGSVDLSLDRAARVTGRVSDKATGAAIPSILVSAYDADGNLAATATTSASGSYTLGLAAGTYRFVAYDPALGYVSAYPQLASTFEESPAYDVTADTTRSVDFMLVHGTRVSGTVVDSSGTALSEIEIGALSENRDRVATTNAHGGTFDLILPPGNYKFVAMDPRGRFLTMYFNGAWTFGSATPVTVSVSGSTPGTVSFIVLPQARRRSVRH
jgi:hypothetical protein